MSPTLAPLRDVRSPPPLPPPAGNAEALFREARARRRRRWRLGLFFTALAIALAAIVAMAVSEVSGPATGRRAAPRQTPVPTRAGRAPTLAWVDNLGGVHVGDPLTGHQITVTTAHADPVEPLVSMDGRLFWVGTGCTYVPISRCPYSITAGYSLPVVREFVLARRTTKTLGPGDAVFSAGDGAVYIERPTLACPPVGTTCDPRSEQVVRVPVSGNGARRVLAVPAGWYVNNGAGYSTPLGVDGDIVVESAPATAIANPVLALWNPATGTVTALGHDWGVIDAHTGRDGAPSLLAWIPASCDGRPTCPLQITNLTAGRTVSVGSPLPYGFDIGGAFSPDGKQLAVFVQTKEGDINPAMELALVDTVTGSIRLIPGARYNIGESVGWARWLPDGTQVLTGTFSDHYRVYNHYLLNATSGAVTKVEFSSNINRDVNFSASQIGKGG
jgi:hypothetical protein